jgi:hypothetical protein
VGGRLSTWTALVILGWILAASSILLGLLVGAFADFDSSGDRTYWILFLVVSGALIIVGLWAINRSPWVGVALIAAGSILGSIAIFWSILYPLAAIALIVLAVLWAGRRQAPPASA